MEAREQFVIVSLESVVQEVLCIQAGAAGAEGDLPLGGIGIQRVAQPGCILKHIILVEHPLLAQCKHGLTLLVGALGNGLVDEGDGLLWLPHVDGQESLGGEVVGEVGAAIVEGEGLGQQAVGDLLGPVVALRRVLNDDVILVGAEHVPLVVEAAEPPAVDVEPVAVVSLEPLDEPDAVEMAAGEGLVAGDDGDEPGLLARVGGLAQAVVVEGVAAVAVGILGIAYEPGQDGRAEVDVRVARLLLAGAHHAELAQVLVGIDEHRAGLGGEHDRVLGSHAAGLLLADALALHHPEVGLLAAVVEDEPVATVERREAVASGLAAHDRAEALAIGRESDCVHAAKLRNFPHYGK